MSRSNNENMNRMDRVERKLEKLKDKMKNPTRFNHDFSLSSATATVIIGAYSWNTNIQVRVYRLKLLFKAWMLKLLVLQQKKR